MFIPLLYNLSLSQQAEGSGDEEEMEGVESESIMTHVSVPSQQEVSYTFNTCSTPHIL